MFRSRLTISFLLANFLYFIINQSQSIRTFYFGTINYVYLIFVIIAIIAFFGLLIWNRIYFNSSIYYFLLVSFFWFLMSWFLVILYISRDTVNFFSKVNSIMLAIIMIVVLITIFFNNYLLKKYINFIFNTLLQLTGLLFIILYLINFNLPEINLTTTDPFLILYFLIAIFSLLNINILLIVFMRSLKRLMKTKNQKINWWTHLTNRSKIQKPNKVKLTKKAAAII
ncbi:hypothetical protein MCAV_01880 [[Mycoplasma] cavipharyngis]|uniref:hypothetical protein n=1 Tax=[Mycoplasma] cavipharyngis TaxID=92757 RepID=UPI00370386D0